MFPILSQTFREYYSGSSQLLHGIKVGSLRGASMFVLVSFLSLFFSSLVDEVSMAKICNDNLLWYYAYLRHAMFEGITPGFTGADGVCCCYTVPFDCAH